MLGNARHVWLDNYQSNMLPGGHATTVINIEHQPAADGPRTVLVPLPTVRRLWMAC